MLKFIKNEIGATLVEVLVTAGMTAIVSLGVATMMQNSMTEQRKLTVLDTLKNQKTKFEFLIRDQASWTKTVGSVANNNSVSAGGPGTSYFFEEIRSASRMTAVSYVNPRKIVLMDASDVIAANFLGPLDTSGNGITEKGAACTTFSTSAGTDACPISYRLMVGAACPSAGATCANPQLKVVARLLYNPSSSGTLFSFKNLIQTINGSDISDTVADGKYDVVVKRTTASVNRSFRLTTKFTPGGAGCAAVGQGGAGSCTVTPQIHPLTVSSTWTQDYDPNILTTRSGGSVSFNETGYYGCVISVPAFATGGFTAKLYNASTGTDIASANTTAGLWAQSTAVIDTKFNVTSTTHLYQIWQKCDSLPSGTPLADYCTLGMSPGTAYGTAQTIISMSCYKLDRSM